MASQAMTGSRIDASSATEMSVASASACRLDQTSAQPMCSRAVMRSYGSDVADSTRVACSSTPSAGPAARASASAASSRRA